MKLFRILLLTAALLPTLPVAAASDLDTRTNARVIAFGDVHGAWDDWTAMLRELGVVDGQFDWAGGNTHLVSVGDLVDRGPGSRQVVELMMHLEAQAARAGGGVHQVLGNHEVMVMVGDLRYVSAPEFAAFASDESPAERDALFAEYRRYIPDGEEAAARALFDQQYPPGFIGLRKAYSSNGALGAWLSRKPFALKINDKVYMHGGISKAQSVMSLEALNQQMQGELQGYLAAVETLREAGVLPYFVSYHDVLPFLNQRVEEYSAANPKQRAPWFDAVAEVFEAQKALVFNGEDSPIWYRGSASCHPLSESFNTEQFLKRADAKQLVIGHTPTRGRVQSRMDGLVIRLDTGMLRSYYGGEPAMLVSNDGADYIHYLGGGRAQPDAEVTSLSQKLSGMSDADLEDFMRTAPITAVKEIGTGVTNPYRVTQARDGLENDAVFKYEDTDPGLETRPKYVSRKHNESDRYVYDIAAYQIDRMLGLEMVPVAVAGEVEGKPGALSDWVTGAINERDRLEQELPFESYCKQWEQYRLRFVFDILIHNDDRNLTNILWTKDDFMLKFIDHSLAFRSTEKRPKQYRKVNLEVSDLLASRLSQLDRATLDAALSGYLHEQQIKAILARRDLILKEAVRTGK